MCKRVIQGQDKQGCVCVGGEIWVGGEHREVPCKIRASAQARRQDLV